MQKKQKFFGGQHTEAVDEVVWLVYNQCTRESGWPANSGGWPHPPACERVAALDPHARVTDGQQTSPTAPVCRPPKKTFVSSACLLSLLFPPLPRSPKKLLFLLHTFCPFCFLCTLSIYRQRSDCRVDNRISVYRLYTVLSDQISVNATSVTSRVSISSARRRS